MHTALEQFSSEQTIASLQARFHNFIGNHGFGSFSYVDLRKIPAVEEPIPYFETTVHSSFIEAYNNERFLSFDPVLRHAWVSTTPFSWYQCPEFIYARKWSGGRRSKSRQILELAYDYEFQDGVIIPVHSLSPSGERISSFLSLYTTDEEKQKNALSLATPVVRLAASLFHERMTELRMIVPENTDIPMLTDRERECLLWAARGKTNSETADIIGIAESSVIFYMRQAMDKLGVFNKTPAVATAITEGHIVP